MKQVVNLNLPDHKNVVVVAFVQQLKLQIQVQDDNIQLFCHFEVLVPKYIYNT